MTLIKQINKTLCNYCVTSKIESICGRKHIRVLGNKALNDNKKDVTGKRKEDGENANSMFKWFDIEPDK